MPESPPSAVEAFLRDRLVRGSPALAAIIDGRVYPCFVPPDGEFPCVVYQRAGTAGRSGHTRAAAGEPKARIELRLYARDYDTTKAMFEPVRALFDGWRERRAVVGTTFDVRSCWITDPGESDDYEESPLGDGAAVFFCRVPLLVCYVETVTVHVT